MSSSQIVYTVDPVFACWEWTGKLDRDGYPIVWRGKLPDRAHRYVYECERGAIPEGMALDHMCRNRKCVAPHHLEPVTRSENERRKSWRYRAKRVSCPVGHPMALHGVVTPNGGKVCRECNREALA